MPLSSLYGQKTSELTVGTENRWTQKENYHEPTGSLLYQITALM